MLMHVSGPSPRIAVGGRNDMASDHPIKLCECGCGQPAPVAKETNTPQNRFAGQSIRFIHGHNARRKIDDLWEYVQSRCIWDNGCLVWQGPLSHNGYGQTNVNMRRTSAHRVVYEYFNGPIPSRLTIDHVKARGCHSTACCNPDHLEAVTMRVNVLRGDAPTAKNAAKTHCPRGHELAGENLRAGQLRRGHRTCRICENARQRKKCR